MKQVPEARSYYTLEAQEDYQFKLPDPPLLEGVKTKEKSLLKIRKLYDIIRKPTPHKFVEICTNSHKSPGDPIYLTPPISSLEFAQICANARSTVANFEEI
ncbi:uncharacterized protein B0H18DRAFT_1129642 [Fomitopsis serialis]|uniref:uncharacterized protein n=1 Tax=Fomitopsis serialis TaxID=139415 RepID=UPI0020087773|nr:uncharacterized protein B0H18DRAFT_1129642 [Neoantrodia serialis]KAH9910716.1 hypothetical protein B0H18DRAFT_1129642 [Neoantrodia serialis]